VVFVNERELLLSSTELGSEETGKGLISSYPLALPCCCCCDMWQLWKLTRVMPHQLSAKHCSDSLLLLCCCTVTM
jgi:hypothetical protein